MSTSHLGEPVARRDRLARVDWCREEALSGERKASQASSRLCGAAGRQGCTSRCRLPLARVMGGRNTSERGLRGCALRRREAGSRPGKGLWARRIAQEGLAWMVPPLTTYIGLPSVCVGQVVSWSFVPPSAVLPSRIFGDFEAIWARHSVVPHPNRGVQRGTRLVKTQCTGSSGSRPQFQRPIGFSLQMRSAIGQIKVCQPLL